MTQSTEQKKNMLVSTATLRKERLDEREGREKAIAAVC
jgi:hypothetical protein